MTQDHHRAVNTNPCFAGIDGDKLSNLVGHWLTRPYLEEVVLVTFAFDPSYELMPESFAQRLAMLATNVKVTLVTARNAFTGPNSIRRTQKQTQMLIHLASVGVNVFINQDLHAKVYLFRDHEKVCWVIGSSNLTSGGLRYNSEVNLRGYRPTEFHEVLGRVDEIINNSSVFRVS